METRKILRINKCYVCFKIFTDELNYEVNNMIIPNDGKSLQLCAECALWSKKNLSNRTENTIILKKKIPNFHCKICFKNFRKKENFELHLKVHSNERPFPCHFCTERFQSSKDMKIHIKSHNRENCKKYKCKLCPISLSRKKYLINHMKTKHDGKGLEGENKKMRDSESGLNILAIKIEDDAELTKTEEKEMEREINRRWNERIKMGGNVIVIKTEPGLYQGDLQNKTDEIDFSELSQEIKEEYEVDEHDVEVKEEPDLCHHEDTSLLKNEQSVFKEFYIVDVKDLL